MITFWAATTEAAHIVLFPRRNKLCLRWKRKWFDIKVDMFKRKTHQKQNKETGGGEGAPDLSAQDKSLTAIVGNCGGNGINKMRKRHSAWAFTQ